MPPLEIRTYPDPVLLKPAEGVATVDREVRRLLDSMAETMYFASGVGLAAPQVGCGRRIIVVDVSGGNDSSQLVMVVNPVILAAEGLEELEEGCLSVPDLTVDIERPTKVRLEGLDQHGQLRVIEAEGLLARALQHEVDHLNGTLIVDHLTGLRGELTRKRLRRQARRDTP